MSICRIHLRYLIDPVFLIASSQFGINYSNLIKGFIDVVGQDIELFGAVAGNVAIKDQQSRYISIEKK